MAGQCGVPCTLPNINEPSSKSTSSAIPEPRTAAHCAVSERCTGWTVCTWCPRSQCTRAEPASRLRRLREQERDLGRTVSGGLLHGSCRSAAGVMRYPAPRHLIATSARSPVRSQPSLESCLSLPSPPSVRATVAPREEAPLRAHRHVYAGCALPTRRCAHATRFPPGPNVIDLACRRVRSTAAWLRPTAASRGPLNPGVEGVTEGAKPLPRVVGAGRSGGGRTPHADPVPAETRARQQHARPSPSPRPSHELSIVSWPELARWAPCVGGRERGADHHLLGTPWTAAASR